jgi:hypothetical protein
MKARSTGRTASRGNDWARDGGPALAKNEFAKQGMDVPHRRVTNPPLTMPPSVSVNHAE